jgi:Uma2 family endonuclease
MIVAVPRVRSKRDVPSLPVRRFSVAEYHRLMQIGILKSGDPYELLNGWIVPKMAINPPHNKAVRLLNRRFSGILGDEWIVQIQGAITLAKSEPEPDLAVISGPEERYDGINPGGKDTLLVVEVADSSLSEDRGEKLKIYARARIPTYWIVNLIDRQVEIYTLPRGGKTPSYRLRQVIAPDKLIPVVLNGELVAEFRVSDVLP